VVAFRDAIAAEHAPVVANLKRAGAVIIGRTNTPAFSMRMFADNALHGRTLTRAIRLFRLAVLAAVPGQP
jgi:amidase